MSDILCRWLNRELRLSETVDSRSFAKDFSNGYLFGEILHKYQIVEDFNMFLKNDSSVAKVNNFSLLEPSLKLLGVFFNKNTARDLMQEKQGVATNLLYQLYVTLEEKKNTGSSQTVMQPTVRAKLHKKEPKIYSSHLPQVVKPSADQSLQEFNQHYAGKAHQLNDFPKVTLHSQKNKPLKVQDEKKVGTSGKVFHVKHDDLTCNNTMLVKPPPCSLNLKRKKRQEQLKEKEAQMVQTEIAKFEEKQHKLRSDFVSMSSSSDQPIPADSSLGGIIQGSGVPGSKNKLILKSNCKYIQGIRQRLKENAAARGERQKRVDRFLVEQFKAHEAEQEAQFEDQMVRRMTRQTQQEQRLAEQLMQIRRQKEVILENRLFREQQYQQQRERDFREALDKEAVLVQHAKLAQEEEIKKELELCNRIAAERAQSRFMKHFARCSDILGQIVDMATKVGEYRLLTGVLIPEKKNKEWKELFRRGLPFYEPTTNFQPESKFFTSPNPSELKKQEILNNLDYDEYINMVDEWAWPKDAEEIKLPPSTNDILTFVIKRIRKIALPPVVRSPSLSFPQFTLKACIMGKFCSGKSTCLAKIGEALGIYVLSTNTLIDNVLRAVKERAKLPNLVTLAEKEMRKGKVVSDELMVNILVEAIRKIPPQCGWILDGFPQNITQAHMLEKALGGSVDEESDIDTAEVAADPDLPKPPPPPPPVLDLALLLDLPDECVVRRAYSQRDTDAAATASQHSDKTMYSTQITQRIAAFQDAWPELERWFGEKQNILVCLDADVEEGVLYSMVESILQKIIIKKHEEAPAPPVKDALFDGISLDITESSVECCSSIWKGNDPKHFGSTSPSSGTVEGSTGGNLIPPQSGFLSLGSVCQLYVTEPLPPHVTEYLCSHWDDVSQSYVNNIKLVMQQLRLQRTLVDRHLFNIRERYSLYVGCPDFKQELVSQWQKSFNSMPDDMRDDEETKAELHLRLDELQERLWDINDRHREEDEQERMGLMCDGWLEEQSAMLINHHSVIIQAELSHFYETLCTLMVYYWSMYRQVPLNPLSIDFSISLLKTTGTKVQEDTQPDSTKSTTKMADQSQSEPSLQEKFLSDYEGALQAVQALQALQPVGNIESAELEEETKVLEESVEEKVTKKGSANNAETDIQKPPEKTHDQEIREKIHKEYTAAMNHEENSVMVRLELVKDHGLMMVSSLEKRVEETFSNMEKHFQARYLSEMKCIDQLSDVVRHHIEAGAKLQYELVLDDSDFYLNGDCQLFPCVSPPPRPAPIEKPNRFIPTVAQLEALYCHLSIMAPSGLISSTVFCAFLQDLVSNCFGRNTVPEAWTDMNGTQLLETVSLLNDEYELIDWRRFLLSAALPWPLPSLTQLLDLLERFKEADVDDTGYINMEQYLQTKLWFSSESVQNFPENPTEPLPYNRPANLQKFFFQLFADHSTSPPQMDYVSMLQYFAVDPNPRQGFIRALSVVLGQHLQQPSQSLLVQSVSSMEETTELTSFKYAEDYKEVEALFSPCSFFKDQEVSISALLNVVCHKIKKMDGLTPLPPGCLSQEQHKENLENVYSELGYNSDESLPFSIISKHPYTQMLIETSTHFQFVDILNATGPSG
ncbi:sperm flagellar protein 2 [Anableps anableps]